MNEYGAILRMTREKLKITLEQASKETKIAAKLLDALEKMEKDKFPAEAYLIGTLDLYSRYLQLDTSKMIELLHLNEMQEKPVEFDVINLQQKKSQKRRRRGLLFGIILPFVLVAFAIIQYRSQIASFVASLIPVSENTTTTQDSAQKTISGLYESDIKEGDTLELEGAQYNATLTLRSVENSIVTIGDQIIELDLNVPYQIDVDNDGSIDYLLVMRSKNIEEKSILLRIDPRTHNQNLIQENLTSDSFPSVEEDAKIQNVLSQSVRAPISLLVEFTDETYFRIRTKDKVIVEANGVADRSYRYVLEGQQATLSFSTDSFVRVTVNGKLLNLEKKNLPVVFDLFWNREQGQEVLKFIPRP